MKLKDLSYSYPEDLVATEPSRPTRVMWVNGTDTPVEISMSQLLEKIPAGDVLVINDTKVEKRRIFSGDIEILFLDFVNGLWKVMFPSKKFSVGDQINLPNGSVMTLVEKGLPQVVSVTPALTEKDFENFGEMPLPPYIQKARGVRHNVDDDQSWYQTAWAKELGSSAAPTASLHFSQSDILGLRARGVQVILLTLHVGLGTFLPVKVDDLNDHVMHEEFYKIEKSDWDKIILAKKNGQHIWALGTTATRAVETAARTSQLTGFSKLMLKPGSEFLVVDRLLTNFHQPESTLLALVSAFFGLDRVKSCYQWAIDKKFKLFSYGDLSVWVKK